MIDTSTPVLRSQEDPWIRAKLDWQADQSGSLGPVQGYATQVCADLAAAAPSSLGLSRELLLCGLRAGCLTADLSGLAQLVVFDGLGGWATLTAGLGPYGGPPLRRPACDSFVEGLMTAEWTGAGGPDGGAVVSGGGLLEQRILSAVPARLGVSADRLGTCLWIIGFYDPAPEVVLKVVLPLVDGRLVLMFDRRLPRDRDS